MANARVGKYSYKQLVGAFAQRAGGISIRVEVFGITQENNSANAFIPYRQLAISN